MPPAPPHPSALPAPLFVRLRNWVGDVTLAVPMLRALAQRGHPLTVAGKGWAVELLAGEPLQVVKLPGTARERMAQMRQWRHEAPRRAPGALDALCLPDSFSSALEFRLAGLRALGHAWEGRRLLLGRALPRPRGVHELQVYWQLGQALLGTREAPPTQIALASTAAQRERAQARMAAAGLAPGFVVICPFAGGTWSGADKTWPAFAGFAAQALPALGRRVVVCPGPGEETALAHAQFGSATVLEGVDLGTYKALLQAAALMVSNDTGPGHMAAALGTPLVSVMGPSDPRLWHPWGPGVQVLGGHGHWPSEAVVLQACRQALATA